MVMERYEVNTYGNSLDRSLLLLADGGKIISNWGDKGPLESWGPRWGVGVAVGMSHGDFKKCHCQMSLSLISEFLHVIC